MKTKRIKNIKKNKTIKKNKNKDTENRHVFIDHSNIIWGANNFLKNKNYNLNKHIKLNINGIKRLTSKGKDGEKLIAGTFQPNSSVWNKWKSHGFKVKIGIIDPNTNKESLIDEFIHAQIYECVLKHSHDKIGKNTLVLLTGDGNSNHNYSNFKTLVELVACKTNWKVEIWSWKHNLSKKFFILQKQIGNNKISIHFLDDYYNQVIK